MKKIILSSALMMSLLMLSFAFNRANAQVFEGPKKGTSIVGVRFGGAEGLGANVSYDYSLARVWKGSFTIGGFVGYHHHYYTNFIPIMLRTTYRFSVVVPEWEVYAGVMLGGAVVVWDRDSWNRRTEGRFAGDFVIGSSYYFTKNIGVNLEFDLGYPTTWVNVGFNFKF
ncbi:MAG: hypothetical protein RRX93_04980 [Bacteroidales bacterium]